MFHINWKRKNKRVLWIIILVIMISLVASGYFLFAKWLPILKTTSESTATSPVSSPGTTPDTTQSVKPISSSTPVASMPSPTLPITPLPTSASTPEPTLSATSEPLPSNSTTPSITYQPSTPIPSTPTKSVEDYGFNPNKIIEFENQSIKEGIINTLVELGYPRMDEITISDLFNLESLIIIPREEEFDENELNCCRDSLGKLTIIYNDYPFDLTFIRFAKNLKAIYCWNNEVEDISSLESLENLIYVGFPENKISDLSSLEQLHSLRGINFFFNSITTIMPIKDLEHLKSIKLVGNMIYNVKPFNDAVYPEINDIWLWSNRITDISPISSLYNLKMIAIGENDIDDFTPLLKLEELSEVYIDQEQSGKNSEFFNELRNKGCAVIIMN